MASTYTAVVQETEKDLIGLGGYSLQVAKAVAGADGKPTFNVVFQSCIKAPWMSVKWKAEYGLNWVTEMPAKGAMVDYYGSWVGCPLGQSFSLDANGKWQRESDNPNANPLGVNIKKNGYPEGVHIIVGAKDEKGKWIPIYVGENPLIVGAHGEYQPLESVQVWFQNGDKTGSMIANQATGVAQKDELKDAEPWYFHYKTDRGTWESQSKRYDFPSNASLAADLLAEEDELIPLISVRKGVYFRNLNFGPYTLSGGTAEEGEGA